jgi:nicotinate-nucleotide pyrophosphorylase (carboxylating)
MLDNFEIDEMEKAVKIIKGKCKVEASGGVTLDTIKSIAETGVDFISVGALTHSVKALDISLEITL